MTEPILVGLLFADKLIEEKNGKKGIIGTFNTFHSARFPVIFPPWAIYAAATNLEGQHSFAINLVCEKTSQVIVNMNGEIQAKSALEVIEITPTIINALFPRAGNYDLTFLIDGKQIGTRLLKVDDKHLRR